MSNELKVGDGKTSTEDDFIYSECNMCGKELVVTQFDGKDLTYDDFLCAECKDVIKHQDEIEVLQQTIKKQQKIIDGLEEISVWMAVHADSILYHIGDCNAYDSFHVRRLVNQVVGLSKLGGEK